MKQRVLIVDDEKLIREMLSRALRGRGHEIEEARDGEEALIRIREDPPDVVLLDLMMPKLDGFDVLDVLRADPRTERVQVIVLTARASTDVLTEALEAGADDYVSKPFHIGEVASRVDAHLRIARYARQLDSQARDGETLLAISHQLTGHLDVKGILQSVTGQVAEMLGTERCSVVILGDDARTGRVVAASDQEDLFDIDISIEDYPEIRRVLETREALLVSDIAAAPLFAAVKAQIAALDVRSVALFPMLHGERCIGVLFLRSSRPLEAFGARERQFGQIVANAAAIAVRNAGLFTEERAIARELAETKDFLQSLVDASPDAIIATDLTGVIRVFNKAAEGLFGYGATDVIDRRHVRDLYPEGGASEVMTLIRSEAHGGAGRLTPPIRREVVADGGTRIPVLLSAAVVRVHGQPVATVGVVRDLRERLAIEQRLAESERLAVLAELAGTTAHELNQPLTSVMGYAELLKRKIDDDDPKFKAASTILREAERMAAIVKQIGQITRYETKPYVGGARIIDLKRSTQAETSPPPKDSDSA